MGKVVEKKEKEEGLGGRAQACHSIVLDATIRKRMEALYKHSQLPTR
jgi:hypothetical protein